MVIQGRLITLPDLNLIRALLEDNPEWGRTRLSEELCRRWKWFSASGRLKDMACRTLLRKLDQGGFIKLPPPRRPANNELRNRKRSKVAHDTSPIHEELKSIRPLQITNVATRGSEFDLYSCLLDKYHYLGHRSCVGENLKYLIRDQHDRPLSCLLFGSSAWATKARDEFIGWNSHQRREGLQWVTNNTRFLIFPWVRVYNLASHILSLITKRIRQDWIEKYNHPVSLLETFVDHSRFTGTCYQAANWIYVGDTTGRTRNSTSKNVEVPTKGIYLYPLVHSFHRELCSQEKKHLAEFQESRA